MNNTDKIAAMWMAACAFAVPSAIADAENFRHDYKPVLVEGREWIMEPSGTFTGEPYRNSYEGRLRVFRLEGDTVVGGRQAKIVRVLKEWNKQQNAYILETEDGPVLTLYRFADTGGEAYAVYEENGVIYAWVKEDWKPILDFNRESLDSICIGGEWYDRFQGDNAIEGIGAMDSYPFMKYQSGPMPAMWAGDILAEVHDNNKPLAEYRELHPESEAYYMVRPDRIWVYGGRNPETGHYYKSLWKFGEPEVKGMRTWRPFEEFERYEWAPGGEPSTVACGEFPKVWLREYRQSVYMIKHGWEDDENLGFNPESEYLLYHFAVNNFEEDENEKPDLIVYDSKNGFMVNPAPYTADCCRWVCRSGDEKSRASYTYGIYGSDEPKAVEGIGITSMGFLPFIYAPGSIDPTNAPRLLEYCDADGKVIEKFGDLPEESGISTIDSEVIAVRWYTLQGVAVDALEHGQIYIRVSGSRAEKIAY